MVGFGRIGTATALRAKAFGFRVVGFDPYISAGTEIAIGIERMATLESLLEVADVVSLHCPLDGGDEWQMIGAEAFRRMKSTAILINTARGQIVDIAGADRGDPRGRHRRRGHRRPTDGTAEPQ